MGDAGNTHFSGADGADGAAAGRDHDLDSVVRVLRGRGDDDLAARVEGVAERLSGEREVLHRLLVESLSVNHDINNALVGVSGNAQLLALGPAASLPAVRDRLDVIQREAERIRRAAGRLSELKRFLQGGGARPEGSDPWPRP